MPLFIARGLQLCPPVYRPLIQHKAKGDIERCSPKHEGSKPRGKRGSACQDRGEKIKTKKHHDQLLLRGEEEQGAAVIPLDCTK